MEARHPEPSCDFCSVPGVVARHQLDTRDVPPWEEGPGRWWFACENCHADLLADRHDALIDRAAGEVAGLTGMDLDRAKLTVERSHAVFHNLDAGVWEPWPLV